jgi:hypothetical protein
MRGRRPRKLARARARVPPVAPALVRRGTHRSPPALRRQRSTIVPRRLLANRRLLPLQLALWLASAVSYLVLLRFVLFVPITVVGFVLLLVRYGGLARIKAARAAEATA